MTENERCILDALSRLGPLTKRDLTARCDMGWATAVKMVARLEDIGYILPEGFGRRNPAGKAAAVYSLSPARPVALGIDVEYSRIHAAICNLRGETLYAHKIPTPKFDGPLDLADFLGGIISEMREKALNLGTKLEGVGIGIPNHLFPDTSMPYSLVKETLSKKTDIPIRVDNNIRCFTHAVARFEPASDSLLVVTIRSGIGVGIVIDGKVYQGEQGRAGELGHLLAEPGGALCRCGRRGCLETIVNKDALARKTGGIPLEEAFLAAEAGDATAMKLVEETVFYLGPALAGLLLVTDIRTVLLYAAFGPGGRALEAPLARSISERVYPDLDFSLHYKELDHDSYVKGAAYLILRDFVVH